MNTEILVRNQREFYYSGQTLPLEYRREMLKKLFRGIEKNEEKLSQALQADLNKSPAEAFLTEISIVKEEIHFMLKSLSSWGKPKRAKTGLALFPAKSRRLAEPYGVVLIMSPWNYPLLLGLQPLAGALAAGNCVLLKPSAYSPQSSAALAELIAETFPPEYCRVIPGGRNENSELLQQKFDYIFFTGGQTVGKLVMESASRYLTPVTLELGGKSPVIVDPTADLELAARRLVFGKFINAGQTCVAPDHVFVHKSIKEEFIARMGQAISQYYGKNADGTIPDYPRIINEKHFTRLTGLLENQTILIGGKSEKAALSIEPTLLDEPSPDSPVMREEIFGPILPVLSYEDGEELFQGLLRRPKPLAFYIFSRDKKYAESLLRRLPFGGGCLNDCIIQVSSIHLPFGGVGESGMGSYHGKASFETFSHYKSVVGKGSRLDFSFRYRPYTPKKLRTLRVLLEKRAGKNGR